MIYPKEFIDELKDVFPDWSEAHKLAENNDPNLGTLLSKTFKKCISIEEVLTTKTLEELRASAFKLKIKIELYHKWCNLYNQQEY